MRMEYLVNQMSETKQTNEGKNKMNTYKIINTRTDFIATICGSESEAIQWLAANPSFIRSHSILYPGGLFIEAKSYASLKAIIN